MTTFLLSCLIPILFFCSGVSFAESADWLASLPSLQLDPVTVISSRLPDSTLRRAGLVETISHDQLVQDVSQTLRENVGLYLEGFGNGSALNVNLRGFSEKACTLVLLDGVKLNDPQNSSVLWSSIPFEQIERIELIKGGNAFIYGEGALAGAINIITRQDTRISAILPVNMDLGLQRRSNVTWKKNAALSQTFSHFDWLLSGDWQEGQTFRNNSAYWDKNYYAKFNLKFYPFTLTYSRQIVSAESQLPGPLDATQNAEDPAFSKYGPADKYYEKLGSNTLDFRYVLDAQQTLKYQYSDRQRYQESIISGWAMPYDMENHTNILEYNGTLGNTSWLAGGEYTQESLALRNGTSGTRRKLAGVFTNLQVPLGENVLMSLAARYDRASITYDDLVMGYDLSWAPIYQSGSLVMSGMSPYVGVDYFFLPEHKLFASFSKTFKVTPFEDFAVLVDSTQGRYRSNTEIEPQVAHHTEMGYRHDGRALRFGIRCYYMYLPDEIRYNPTSWQNENFETEHSGGGVNFSYTFSPAVMLRNTFVLDRARFLSGNYKGKTLPYVNSSKFSSDFECKLTRQFAMTLSYYAVGSYYPVNDLANNFQQPGYTRVDVHGNYIVNDYEIYGGVTNLMDARYPASSIIGASGNINYYPADRRVVFAGVKYRI